MLPCSLLLSLRVPLAVFLVYDSWLLTIVCTFILFLCRWLLLRYPWRQYVVTCLCTDLADVTKCYLNGCGSCIWMAEYRRQGMSMVGALPVKESPLGRKQLQLLHLSVTLEHRREGIGKTLVRTVLHFA
jgi:ribosomal protein S18 acetylase RimI-like enzyme